MKVLQLSIITDVFKNKKTRSIIFLLLIVTIIPLFISTTPFLRNWFWGWTEEGMEDKNMDFIKKINTVVKQQKFSEEDKLALIENYVEQMETTTNIKSNKMVLTKTIQQCKMKNPNTCIKSIKTALIDMKNDGSVADNKLMDDITNIVKDNVTKIDIYNLVVVYINKLEKSDEKKELTKILKDPETCSTTSPIECMKAIENKTTEYIAADESAQTAKKSAASMNQVTDTKGGAAQAEASVVPITPMRS